MSKFRKILVTLLGVICTLTMAFSFIACDSTPVLKVTFKVDGETYKTVDVKMEQVITLPQEPTKEGCTFDGWYVDDITFQRPFTENSMIEEKFNVDITVYAKWKEADNGNNEGSANDEFRFKTLVFDGNTVELTVRSNVEQFNLGEEIIATGNYKYTVSAYCSNYENGIANLRTGNNSFEIHVTKENDDEFSKYYFINVKRLYAYKVEFSTDGGTQIETQYVDEGYLATKPEDPVKNGYDFTGWNFDFDTPITWDTYIYARYTLATYTITYDLDGFDAEVPQDNATSYTIKSSRLTLKNIKDDVTREESGYTYGYTFVRWECDGQEITQIKTGSYGNKTIKAVWKKNYIYFGEYPQRYVGHETNVDFAGSTKDERGYYLASNNCYYAQITASLYDSGRKYFTSGHQVISGVKYQFKVEPIKWRILCEEDGTLFLLCENALDNPKFDNLKLNDYEESNIRTWLNNDFYNIAFSTTEKQKILTTEVDNSAKSANPYGSPNEFDNGGNYGNLITTYDKVFLLSVEEATNPNYGFDSKYNANDLLRRKYATDYAIAKGVFYNDTGFIIDSGHGKIGSWWLRSVVPATAYIRTVSGWSGDIGESGYTNSTRVGVVPAIKIQL
ncbi:MAG: InlB B-repeat-containing protein [Clostridia bacterium]|nr:InlB B-repeat-containing protein [Clostridia bacterium]